MSSVLDIERITKYDDHRHAEITLEMTKSGDVAAIEIFYYCPIPLYRFSLTNLFSCGGCNARDNQPISWRE